MTFLDFDGTIFNTQAFEEYVHSKNEFAFLHSFTGVEFTKACAEAAEAGKLSFEKGELTPCTYTDAVSFVRGAENSAMIITFGDAKLQRMKVESALAGIARLQVMYTGEIRKGDYLKPYVDMYGQSPKLIDADIIELEILSETCPTFQLFHMIRGDIPVVGKWPILHSMDDLR